MNWAELPVKLKVYIVFLISLAAPISVWAAGDILSAQYNPGWLALLVLTIATIPFFLFLPSANATIAIGDAYIMAMAMMYGVAPCVITTLLHYFALSIFAKKPRIPLYRILFNTSSMVCAAWLYSSVFQFMTGGNLQIALIILPAVVMVCTFFFVNSALTSIAISWSIGERVTKFWAKTCMPMAIDFSVSAVAATIIVSLHSWNEYIPLAAAPLAWSRLGMEQDK